MVGGSEGYVAVAVAIEFGHEAGLVSTSVMPTSSDVADCAGVVTVCLTYRFASTM
jgi:hypothetical protein